MAYSLREAAAAAGKGKPAILKAIQSGKISAQKDEFGAWHIEPAELHRVYPPVSRGTTSEPSSKEPGETVGNGNGNRLLEQEIQFLREKLTDLQKMKDDERRNLSERIEELRRDRDDLRDERDQLLKVIEEQASSMRLLTDRRAEALPAPIRIQRSWLPWRRRG